MWRNSFKYWFSVNDYLKQTNKSSYVTFWTDFGWMPARTLCTSMTQRSLRMLAMTGCGVSDWAHPFRALLGSFMLFPDIDGRCAATESCETTKHREAVRMGCRIYSFVPTPVAARCYTTLRLLAPYISAAASKISGEDITRAAGLADSDAINGIYEPCVLRLHTYTPTH